MEADRQLLHDSPGRTHNTFALQLSMRQENEQEKSHQRGKEVGERVGA